MWKWLTIIWVLTGATWIYGVVTGLNAMKEREAARCHAAKETVLLEQRLLDWTDEFPQDTVTNRWKALLEGCS